uniref:Uncharacterized protein n=1 Tax=Leersia perrieri TaxID=77586 RepID=A0A0D9UWM6_9ORYZ
MALFAAARRAAAGAATSSLPHLRASTSGATRGATLLCPPAATGAARPHQPRSMPFSSVAKPRSEGELLRIIDSEIKYAVESDDHDRVVEIPDNFPFKISDGKGTKEIILRRTYQGEKIEVLVTMPSTSGLGHENDKEEKEGTQRLHKCCMPVTVTISKGNGPTLEFICTTYPDEILIDAVSVISPVDGEDETLAYEGPEFIDLDEDLQKAFHQYLELRGITTRATNFLCEYMINKDSREYLIWLKKLQNGEFRRMNS